MLILMTSVEAPSGNSNREPVVQKKCASCHHPLSFHGNGVTGCKAMGCRCGTWSEDDPFGARDHYAAVVTLLRALEVPSRLVTQGERPLIYVGGYVEPDLYDLSEAGSDSPGLPGGWQPPFAIWANYEGSWGYSVVDREGMVTESGTDVMPHDTGAEEVARIVATWTYPNEAMEA
jgi:hypothetical protein